jgi:fatty-acyl-CoA synthase
VVPQEEHRNSLTKQEIMDYLTPRVIKWWLPDDIVFIESVPKTSVGKFAKTRIREAYASGDYDVVEVH